MGNQRPTPGVDEIIVSPPWGQRYCARLDHTVTSTPARLVVTFGAPGVVGRAVLFPGCPGRSYPLCTQCFDDTRHLARTVWAGLTLRDHQVTPGPRAAG